MISARKTVYLRVFVCSFPFHDFMKTKLCILLDQPYFSLSDRKRDVIAGRGSHALALALALDVRKRRADGTEDVLSLSEQAEKEAAQATTTRKAERESSGKSTRKCRVNTPVSNPLLFKNWRSPEEIAAIIHWDSNTSELVGCFVVQGGPPRPIQFRMT
ncbi:hypothetical protein BSKO_14058 [Bryopsis sp. KO-2023]|nr:hypothetical protein BSKO_01802 [Bryopsis sp. KO-2023]GMH46094.1 hypothetical protein BSKO_14058 [Bryopsis sp. KO-2023]